MIGISGLVNAGGGTIEPNAISGLKLWLDSETNISGTTNGAIDAIGDRSSAANNVSNTSGAGSRPVWADLNTGPENHMFSSNTKHGIHFEAGGDWLSLTGLDTATPFTCPTAMSVFHTSKHINGNNAPNVANNTPLNILSTVGFSATLYTNVGFNAGQAQFMTWTGAAYVFYSSVRTDLNDNQPHTVCWSYSGTTLTCFIDGVLDSTQAVAAYQTTNGFNGLGGNGNNDAYQGGVAEVMVWNAALNSNQARQLHNRAKGLWF